MINSVENVSNTIETSDKGDLGGGIDLNSRNFHRGRSFNNGGNFQSQGDRGGIEGVNLTTEGSMEELAGGGIIKNETGAFESGTNGNDVEHHKGVGIENNKTRSVHKGTERIRGGGDKSRRITHRTLLFFFSSSANVPWPWYYPILRSFRAVQPQEPCL